MLSAFLFGHPSGGDTGGKPGRILGMATLLMAVAAGALRCRARRVGVRKNPVIPPFGKGL